VGLNEFKLKNGFKSVFGTGVYEYLVEIRLEKARLMLESTPRPVKEIANMVGYKNASSFIRAFRRKFKESPHSMRLMARRA
jgi:AraC-like DNA-binding protein